MPSPEQDGYIDVTHRAADGSLTVTVACAGPTLEGHCVYDASKDPNTIGRISTIARSIFTRRFRRIPVKPAVIHTELCQHCPYNIISSDHDDI